VEHADDHHAGGLHAVNDDEGGSGNNQFARPGQAARPAAIRELPDLGGGCSDRVSESARSRGITLSDVNKLIG
jgi:hypothetical protein